MDISQGAPPGAAVTARVLTVDEWPIWRELRLQALADAPEAFGSTLAEWTGSGDSPDRWRNRLRSVPRNVVLYTGGRPVGMVGGQILGDGMVELISLWVAPCARGRGIGDAAIEHIVGWANGADVSLSVRQDNLRAQKLYARHGFVHEGLSPDDPSELRFIRRRTNAADLHTRHMM
ncbi:GNAT family N-acetyltransferase [Gordonia sp. ABSL1-1]|uniref:GNAT family N-acetyltransferase n=1 Tax=Gordonia sp. ABSL1-1 TaxID=3053923 RepID=UPI002572CF33|nr:GNAT family N-acetyltransferase [Gordonia sp. ABSL1-1]MDL9938906.1 GNAT family N-acetyltransferase [Gordonia sp. ABSL1-1]